MKKKLSVWAKENGVSYRIAFFWIKNGKFPKPYEKTVTGRYIVNDTEDAPLRQQCNIIYARVSNHSRKDELEYQVQRLEDFCIKNGYQVNAVYKEVASGMNDNRKELWKAINRQPTRIFVENKDRLTRFGFNYLSTLLSKLGTEVVVVNEAHEDKEDLIKDLCSVIYSFCARLYGMRRAQNKATKIKHELNIENNLN